MLLPKLYLQNMGRTFQFACSQCQYLHRGNLVFASFRVANPERLPRQIIRLLHRVTRIEFDVCATEEAARYREELIICVLNPRFNGAGKVWPQSAARRDFFLPVSQLARFGKKREYDPSSNEPFPAATQPSQREAEAPAIRRRQRRGDLPGRQPVDLGKRAGETGAFKKAFISMVPAEGVEPTHPHGY